MNGRMAKIISLAKGTAIRWEGIIQPLSGCCFLFYFIFLSASQRSINGIRVVVTCVCVCVRTLPLTANSVSPENYYVTAYTNTHPVYIFEAKSF